MRKYTEDEVRAIARNLTKVARDYRDSGAEQAAADRREELEHELRRNERGARDTFYTVLLFVLIGAVLLGCLANSIIQDRKLVGWYEQEQQTARYQAWLEEGYPALDEEVPE